jgi:myosin heavy subunit
MAQKGGERRLLFDTRGRRRHVIRVVYAILAILMGTSLFLVIGPLNIGELLGESSSGGNAADVFHEQAERIEKRLARSPDDEGELLALTRARINAANAQIEPAAAGEAPTIDADARDDFQAASEAWSRYLKAAGDEPSPTAAQLVALTTFRLAESSTSVNEAIENVARATKAQKIAAEQRPTLNSLSTLAIYQYFNGEYAAADKTAKQAAAKAPSKTEAKNIEKQLAEYRKNSKAFDKQKQELAKVQKQVNKERLQSQSPLGFGGGGAAVGE